MAKLSKYFSFSIILLFIYFSCGTNKTFPSSEAEISSTQLKKILDDKIDVIIIDVRTSKEYTGELGHISGSILKPVQKIESWASEFDSLKSKNIKIIMVCRSGIRSASATKYFIEKGFSNVYNLVGGMKAWNKAQYPIEKNFPENNE